MKIRECLPAEIMVLIKDKFGNEITDVSSLTLKHLSLYPLL